MLQGGFIAPRVDAVEGLLDLLAVSHLYILGLLEKE